MNTTIDLKTAKTIEAMNQKINHIKDFDRYAKRYHIDYSIQKDLSCKPPRYLIYFKAQDTDALNAAFKEYSAYLYFFLCQQAQRACAPKAASKPIFSNYVTPSQ